MHPSNYVIEGFTASVSVAELAGLGVLVVGDIGSGLLRPSPVLPDEPDADTWLRAGAGLVTASGDKLLGGPQAGLLLGQPETVTRLARHPLARALRVDKLTLAALEATLNGPLAPVTQAMTATGSSLDERGPRSWPGGWRSRASTAGRCRPMRRSEGAAGPASRCRAPRCPCPSDSRPACGRARRCAAGTCQRSSAGSRAAGCCSTCARSRPPTTSGSPGQCSPP